MDATLEAPVADVVARYGQHHTKQEVPWVAVFGGHCSGEWAEQAHSPGLSDHEPANHVSSAG